MIFLSFDKKRDWRKNARQKGILLLMPTFVSFPQGNHVSLLFENAKSACVQDIRRIFLPFPCAKNAGHLQSWAYLATAKQRLISTNKPDRILNQ